MGCDSSQALHTQIDNVEESYASIIKVAVEVAPVISRQCRGFQAENFGEAVQLGKAVDGCATVIAAGDAQIVAKDLTKVSPSQLPMKSRRISHKMYGQSIRGRRNGVRINQRCPAACLSITK